MADKIKIAVAVAAGVAGIAGFYYLAESAMIIRVAAVLAGLRGGRGGRSRRRSRARSSTSSAQESVAETKKVVWPTRKETLQTTGIVFAFVVVMALFLWMVDASLLWVVKKLLGQSEHEQEVVRRSRLFGLREERARTLQDRIQRAGMQESSARSWCRSRKWSR